MFQPLEQFVSWKISSLIILLDLTYYRILIIDKYLLVIFIVLLLLCITILKLSIKPSVLLIGIYNWLQNEFLNVTGFSLVFFIPLFCLVFSYIYIFNLIGLLPYTPCWTTQFFANLTISFILILGITLLNIDKNGFNYFQLFIPSGVPQILKPLLFILEFLSYWIRILSLSIRLFSNMVAGHSLLHILFDMSLNVKNVIENTIDVLLIISIVALLVIYIIVIFEFIVAFLQAYVFAVMFSIYLNDLKLSH